MKYFTLGVFLYFVCSLSFANIIEITDEDGILLGLDGLEFQPWRYDSRTGEYWYGEASYYDVRFETGTFEDVYGMPKEEFTRGNDTNNIVFELVWSYLNSSDRYLENPELIYGCEPEKCKIYYPYMNNPESPTYYYERSLVSSWLEDPGLGNSFQEQSEEWWSWGPKDDGEVFAVWSTHSAPEPSTLTLFCVGLFGVLFRRKRSLLKV